MPEGAAHQEKQREHHKKVEFAQARAVASVVAKAVMRSNGSSALENGLLVSGGRRGMYTTPQGKKIFFSTFRAP